MVTGSPIGFEGMEPLEQGRPGCLSPVSATATTQPVVAQGERLLDVTVTVCNLAGDVLLRNVDLSMTLNSSVAEFARSLLDHMTPAPPGHFYAFTSSCFSEALTQHRVDCIHGLTRSRDEALHHICIQPLHDWARLELQAVTVSTELENARREERESYATTMEKAHTERVYLAAMGKPPRWNFAHNSFAGYEEARSHWTERQNDLDSARQDASDRLEKELATAEYICPYAGFLCPLHTFFHTREELQEHLYMVHRSDDLRMHGLRLPMVSPTVTTHEAALVIT